MEPSRYIAHNLDTPSSNNLLGLSEWTPIIYLSKSPISQRVIDFVSKLHDYELATLDMDLNICSLCQRRQIVTMKLLNHGSYDAHSLENESFNV